MDEKLLKVYKDFCEYVIDKTGTHTRDQTKAKVLRKEVKTCMKEGKELSSYWRLTAHDLFKDFKINDERINTESILEEVKFEYKGKEYVTDVRYLDFDVDKFPEESILTQNFTRENERDYIIRILKRSLDRYENCDTSKVYAYKNYVLVLASNGS